MNELFQILAEIMRERRSRQEASRTGDQAAGGGGASATGGGATSSAGGASGGGGGGRTNQSQAGSNGQVAGATGKALVDISYSQMMDPARTLYDCACAL